MRIILLLLDIRSAHNVGSIIRSAECFGVQEIWCIGITPYPVIPNDTRLPHIAKGADQMIHKTALGAENLVAVTYKPDFISAYNELKSSNTPVYALEQSSRSVLLHEIHEANWMADATIAVVLGNEPQGIAPDILALLDGCIEIKQFGKKESLNVSVAAGIALYELTKQM